MEGPNSKFSYISSLPDICQLDEATELYLVLQLPFLRLFFLIHVSSGRCIMSNKWTNSLARKSCILWLTYEELSQVIRASFISKLLGDLRTLQHAVPGIASALTREEHQQAKELSIDWEEYQEESGCIMYTESARTPREKKGFTLACLAHSRPAAPTWRACQA